MIRMLSGLFALLLAACATGTVLVPPPGLSDEEQQLQRQECITYAEEMAAPPLGSEGPRYLPRTGRGAEYGSTERTYERVPTREEWDADFYDILRSRDDNLAAEVYGGETYDRNEPLDYLAYREQLFRECLENRGWRPQPKR